MKFALIQQTKDDNGKLVNDMLVRSVRSKNTGEIGNVLTDLDRKHGGYHRIVEIVNLDDRGGFGFLMRYMTLRISFLSKEGLMTPLIEAILTLFVSTGYKWGVDATKMKQS